MSNKGKRDQSGRKQPKVAYSTREKTVGFVLSKGQMFLIGAILIIVSLVLLRNLMGVFMTAQEEEAGESIVLDAELRNIKGEYNYIIGIATQQATPNVSAISNLYNISDLIRNDKDAKILYMLVYVNGTNQRYTVVVGNFLNDRINATVNVTDSTTTGSAFGNVNDKINVTAEFFPNTNITINVTLNYTLQSNNISEVIKANIGTRNHFSLFYDITLESGNALVRGKDIYNTTW
jgi:hypothetical protein